MKNITNKTETRTGTEAGPGAGVKAEGVQKMQQDNKKTLDEEQQRAEFKELLGENYKYVKMLEGTEYVFTQEGFCKYKEYVISNFIVIPVKTIRRQEAGKIKIEFIVKALLETGEMLDAITVPQEEIYNVSRWINNPLWCMKAILTPNGGRDGIRYALQVFNKDMLIETIEAEESETAIGMIIEAIENLTARGEIATIEKESFGFTKGGELLTKEIIGIYDKQVNVNYIYPNKLFGKIKKFYSEQGIQIGFSKGTMNKELMLNGFLYKTEKQDRPTIRRLNPRTKREETVIGLLQNKIPMINIIMANN